MLADPSIPLWITEGQKKADALASHGLCAIALLGVWNFKGKNPFGGTTLLADFDYIALDGRDLRIVFDNDVMTKRPVQQALARLTEHLHRRKTYVTAVYYPRLAGRKLASMITYSATVFRISRVWLSNLGQSPNPRHRSSTFSRLLPSD